MALPPASALSRSLSIVVKVGAMMALLAGCSEDATPTPQVTVAVESPTPPASAADDDAHRQAAIAACLDFAKKHHVHDFDANSLDARFIHLSQDEFDHAAENPLNLYRPAKRGQGTVASGTSGGLDPSLRIPGQVLPSSPPERPLECWRIMFAPKDPIANDPQSMGRHYFVVQNTGKIIDCGVVILPLSSPGIGQH